MRPTRRSVLKSGFAGLVAAGSSATGISEPSSLSPKAVISSSGSVLLGPDGTYSLSVFIVVQPNIQFAGTTFTISSFSMTENIAQNIPLLIKAIELNGGPQLQPDDLLFFGFDFLRG